MHQLNRPAVIELIGANGEKYQLLVTALDEDRVELEIDGARREFSRDEVAHYWFGKYLTLWRPPPSGELVLRVGMQGPAVVWLQRALARVDGETGVTRADGTFDTALETKVRAFQRRHGLEPDGVVGRNTLIQLDAYDADIAPVPLARSSTETEVH